MSKASADPDRITPDVLEARIAAGSTPVILDVRSAAEYANGHVPGAIHIPFWNVGAHIDKIPCRHGDEVVVYCGHGPRAAWARRALKRRGFSRVVELVGHWAGWAAEKRPISR